MALSTAQSMLKDLEHLVFSSVVLVFGGGKAVSIRQLLNLEQSHNRVYKAVCCKYNTSCKYQKIFIISQFKQCLRC